MTGDRQRPASRVWERAEMERRSIRAVEAAEWQRRMLRAGGIDPEHLSEQGRRILAWLAEWDDWTVDGVVELLTTAHRAGQVGATDVPDPVARRAVGDARVDAAKARLAAVRQQHEDPAVGL